MKKVEGHQDLRRTTQGAIIDVSRERLERALAKKKVDALREDKINSLEERIARLEKLINA